MALIQSFYGNQVGPTGEFEWVGPGAFRLDIGSGAQNQKAPLDEWVHLDARPGNHVEIVCDFADIPVKNGQVDHIHAGDVIEHVPVYRHFEVFSEWNRIMKLGGIITGSMPNLDRIMKSYAKGELDLRDAVLGLYGWMNRSTEQHFVTFTKESLADMMSGYGFDIDDFSGSPGPVEAPWWLVFKGRKVGAPIEVPPVEVDGSIPEPGWLRRCAGRKAT